jgi:flagellar motor switch protein FliG
MPDITGVRKSAVLLLSLDQDQAAEVLKRLPPEAVEEVSREIASLGEIALSTRREVFGEFYNLALANSYLAEGGPRARQGAAPKVAQRRRRRPRHQAGHPAGSDDAVQLPPKGRVGETS